MPIPPLAGHQGVRSRLAAAWRAGRLPQALLLTGTRGVGKQRLALWLAQLIQCQTGAGEEPCGECQACRQVAALQHPDVHWFVPLELAKKGADADKQVALVEEALADEMASRREQPLYAPPGGMATHSIAAVRLLLRRLALTPAVGARKVFIVGDAERLIPQRGSEDAANALLKALEEPPADAVLILTASDPNALLPTILSRVVLVRVARLADSVVAAFAQQALRKDAKDDLEQRVSAAEGCIGKLLALGGGRSGEGTAKGSADRFLRAPLAYALAQMPFQARGGFTDMLDALAGRLRSEARRGGETGKLVEAIARVMDAREMAQGNVNPQLLAAVLADELSGDTR
ncbi:MAG: ATP-binding protein [Gemmatimonadales bacterium]